MAFLLIENLAQKLNLNPLELSSSQLRSLCILIDWTVTIYTYQSQKISIITPNFDSTVQFDDLLCKELTSKLACAIQGGIFQALVNAHTDKKAMENMFLELCKTLGFPYEYCFDILDSTIIGTINQYEKMIENRGLVYTNFLTYVPETAPIKCMELCEQSDNPENIGVTSHYENLSLDELKGIELRLINLINHERQPQHRRELCEALYRHILAFPFLRNWPTINNIEMNKAIDRVILLGIDDLADHEITMVTNMALRNHQDENIVITFDINEVKQIEFNNSLYNHRYILQVIGHGYLDAPLISNIGPLRGLSSDVGIQLANLINACPNIGHLRISSCYSGRLNPNTAIHNLPKKK